MTERPKRAPRDVMRGRASYNIAQMSDEDIQDMLDSFSNSSESECSDEDEEYVPDIYDIPPEDYDEIECDVPELRQSSSFLSSAISMSLNVGDVSVGPDQSFDCILEQPAGPSTSSAPSEATSSSAIMPPPPSSEFRRKKAPRAKRARSPLPIFEEGGPSSDPDAGGFTVPTHTPKRRFCSAAEISSTNS